MTTSISSPFETSTELAQLWRQKFVIALATLVLGLAGLGASLAMPKVYESHVEVQIGLGLGELLEQPDTVARVLNGAGFAEQLPDRVRAFGPGALSAEVIINPRPRAGGDAAEGIHIIGRGRTPEEAKTVAALAGEFVVTRHRPLYERARRESDEYRTTLKSRIDAMLQEIDVLERAVRPGEMTKGGDRVSLLLLLQERREQVLRYSRELRDYGVKGATVTSETTMAAPPSTPGAPIWPRPRIFAAASAGLGFSLAVAWILVAPLLAGEGRQSV